MPTTRRHDDEPRRFTVGGLVAVLWFTVCLGWFLVGFFASLAGRS